VGAACSRLCSASFAAISLIVAGCSLQHHTDKAERQWLRANQDNPALYSVALAGQSLNENEIETSFLTAPSANTYLSGHISSPNITELSGLAPMQAAGTGYWAINDSGNKPELFAISGNGQHLETFELPIVNRDWEAIASFKLHGKSWLLIGDVGDNLYRHAVSSLYLFEEPEIAGKNKKLKLTRRIEFSYPEGPQNVEAMAVSVGEKAVYLIGKDSKAASIYTIPLNASGRTVALKVGALAELPTSDENKWWERMFASRILMSPTALDISSDDRLAVVSNYRHVYMFKRNSDESWHRALASSPQLLTTHRMEQSEAVSFSPDTDQVTLVTNRLIIVAAVYTFT